MNLHNLGLFLLFLPGGGRRSIRIDDSHGGAQQQSNALANGLEVSAVARETFLPGAFGTDGLRPAGSQAGAWHAGAKRVDGPCGRFVPHRAKVALRGAVGPEAGQLPSMEESPAQSALLTAVRCGDLRLPVSRRAACAAALASLASGRRPALAAGGPRITSTAELRLVIQSTAGESDAFSDEALPPLVIGLYGDEAPASVAFFQNMCGGTVPNLPKLTYKGSTVTRIEKDKLIVLGKLTSGAGQEMERKIDSTGYVRTTVINLAERFTNDDRNALSHDRAGLVSAPRGGGAFEFGLTPAANAELDADRIVIGEVVEGMDALSRLNGMPARQPAKNNEVGGVVWALGGYDESRYAAVAKAGGDPRAKVDQAYRPLQKIRIAACELRK